MENTLTCHRCDYDLREHVDADVCPECEASVTESKRIAAIPIRPAWRDSDPRWRRRVLFGIWILVLLQVLLWFEWNGWFSHIPVPSIWPGYVEFDSLDDTLATWYWAAPVFCIGVVLLFAKERNRRRNRLEWTQRMGVFLTYCVALLVFVPTAFIFSLVAIGFAALFHTLPMEDQPAFTELMVTISAAFIGSGLHPTDASDVALPAFSAAVVILGCRTLYLAIISSGSRGLAITVIAPLMLVASVYILATPLFWLRSGQYEVIAPENYFFNGHGIGAIVDVITRFAVPSSGRPIDLLANIAITLCTCFIAVWLTLAQVRSWRLRSKA